MASHASSSGAASNAVSGPSESQSQSQTATEEDSKPISSDDIGWNYGTYAEKNNKDKVKCNFCPKVVSGGIYRLKEHLAGRKCNVTSCKRVSEKAKADCIANLEQIKEKENHVEEVRSEVNIELGDELEDVGSKRKPPHTKSIMEAYHICEEKFFPDDIDAQCNLSNIELEMYRGKKGGFGKPVATLGYAKNDDKYNPVAWWNTYGFDTPNLKRMAMRILSLTTSASGCERNWSAFEGIHTKKRNRLDSTRLNDLVYVQFNARINNKKQRVKQKEIDVLLGSDASKAQSWIIDCDDDDDEEVELDREIFGDVVGVDGGLQPGGRRNVEVREIYGEDFVSDKDTDDESEPDVW